MSSLTIQRIPKQTRYFCEDLGNNIELEMIPLSGGKFLMGSPADEIDRRENEGPQHEVIIQPFSLGRYPITQEQWRVVAALRKKERKLELEPSDLKGDRRPVEQISWFDATEFCARLTTHTGRPYRLPTEAEWEYACRAGTTTPFHFGTTISAELANYDGNYTYADGAKGEYRRETTEVDHFGIANDFGLCDMHGNVFEWCQDHWHEDYKKAPTDGSAWLTDEENALRVIRGGSWVNYPYACRSAYRNCCGPDGRYDLIGLRIACAAPRTQ